MVVVVNAIRAYFTVLAVILGTLALVCSITVLPIALFGEAGLFVTFAAIILLIPLLWVIQ